MFSVVLGLGVSVVAALLTLVDALFLSPLPYRESDALFGVGEVQAADALRNAVVSPAELRVMADIPGVTAVTGYAGSRTTLAPSGEVIDEGVIIAEVDPAFFVTLATAPLYGRLLSADDRSAGTFTRAVISYRCWRDRFAANPAIVDEIITLPTGRLQIVGVMPPRFDLPVGVEAWVPIREQVRSDRRFLTAIVRLSAATHAASVSAALTGLRSGTQPADHRLVVRRLRDIVRPGDADSVLVLFVSCALLLIGASSQIAFTQVARLAERSSEIDTRVALGASTPEVIRASFMETSLLLIAASGLAASILPPVRLALVSLLPPELAPIDVAIPLGKALRALAAVVGVALIIVWVVCGVEVTRRVTRFRRDKAVAGGSRWPRRLFVGGQIALAVVLVYEATLMASSLAAIRTKPLGFDPAGLYFISARFSAGGDRVAGPYGELETLASVLQSLPNVISASVSDSPPFGTAGFLRTLRTGAAEVLTVRWRTIGPRYLETVGIGLIAGESFGADGSRTGVGVALVNETANRRLGPDGTSLGRTLSTGVEKLRIIGVLEDMRDVSRRAVPEPEIYVPMRETNSQAAGLVLRIRESDAGATLPLVRATLQRSGVQPSSIGIRSIEAMVRRDEAPQRSRAILLGTVAIVAMALTVLTIVGTGLDTLGRRARDFGIRMALGGQARQIRWAVLRDELSAALLPVGIGVWSAATVGKLFATHLVDLQVFDPWIAAAVCALVLGTIALSTWMLSRRIEELEPAHVLRHG